MKQYTHFICWDMFGNFCNTFSLSQYIYILTPPDKLDATQGQSFKANFYRFKFRVFFLLEQLPYQGYKVKSKAGDCSQG